MANNVNKTIGTLDTQYHYFSDIKRQIVIGFTMKKGKVKLIDLLDFNGRSINIVCKRHATSNVYSHPNKPLVYKERHLEIGNNEIESCAYRHKLIAAIHAIFHIGNYKGFNYIGCYCPLDKELYEKIKDEKDYLNFKSYRNDGINYKAVQIFKQLIKFYDEVK